MPKHWRHSLFICCLGLGLTACQAIHQTQEPAEPELTTLMNMSRAGSALNFKEKLTEVREASLKEIALGAGAQAGLAWQAQQFKTLLDKNSAELDAIFNFNALLLENGVLPPVITEGRKTWHKADEQTIRVAEKTYYIEQQARFSGTVPNWRDYLSMEYEQPDDPELSLLPRNRQEQKVWRKYARVGWDNGVNQANKIYEANLGRLKHEMQGMLLYRKLLAQRIVSPPFVATSNLGVTGGGARLNVNDQVLRITNLPSLQANTDKWDPQVGK